MSMKSSKALSSEVEVAQVRELQRRTNENSRLIDSIVNKLVQEYCSQLDNYMRFIEQLVTDPINPPTDRELDDFTLNLPVLLYFTGEAQESLGIKEDIAKAIRQEVFNQYYEAAEGTIADKTAQAELASQNETINHIAYQRAYKKIKLRMEAGYEMLNSVKKVITRRGQEYEMAGVTSDRIGGR